MGAKRAFVKGALASKWVTGKDNRPSPSRCAIETGSNIETS
jgi:hypothetical protein